MAGGPTILVLEDEAALREVLVDVLQGAGYVVRAAVTPGEALTIALAEKIDVMVSDVALTGASGADVAEQVRRLHAGVGILYISGYIDPPLGQAAARVAGASFSQKPFKPEALLREVAQLHSLPARRE